MNVMRAGQKLRHRKPVELYGMRHNDDFPGLQKRVPDLFHRRQVMRRDPNARNQQRRRRRARHNHAQPRPLVQAWNPRHPRGQRRKPHQHKRQKRQFIRLVIHHQCQESPNVKAARNGPAPVTTPRIGRTNPATTANPASTAVSTSILPQRS